MELKILEEVQEAIASKTAVVALESTIISHGMPYPENLETARAVEQVVRDAHAIPATIAILDGRFNIGLGDEELERLARGTDVMKASRRDLPVAFAEKRTAATTVATTMIAAASAGIALFATGGVGGVHRGVSSSMDVSADLQEFGRTSVAVVSAGVKAILDIPKTLEYLETMGVPVLGYRTDAFPAFYSRESGEQVHHTVDTPEGVASILGAKWRSGLEGGVLIANPIPEEDELAYGYIEEAIQRALEDASNRGIKGKEVTPFLLKRIVEITGGESLKANIALVKNNADLAGRVAAAYAALGE